MCGSVKVGKVLVSLIVLLFLAAAVFAAPDPKTADVEVTVEAYAEITLNPTDLNWSSVNIGSPGGAKNLTIKNTGSVNVTNIYIYPDTLTDESTSPYASSDPQGYAAGGLITAINQTGAEQYYFVGRVEWNWTSGVSNTDLSNLTYFVSYGFFKNNSNEYFWAVGANSSGDEGLCNQTDAEFALEDDEDAGVVGTRTPSTVDIVHDANNKEWGIFSVNRATSPLNGYCVAVNRTCDKVYIYKYDKRNMFSNCVNSRYLRDAPLTPGSSELLTLDIFAPLGLPAGTLRQATLTLVAS